jgi:hypothetical protein
VLNAIATGAGLAALWYFSPKLVKPLQHALTALDNIQKNNELFNSSIDKALSALGNDNDTDTQILLELFARYSKLQVNDPVKMKEIQDTLTDILAEKPMRPAFKYKGIGKKQTWKPSARSYFPYTSEFHNSKHENIRIKKQD